MDKHGSGSVDSIQMLIAWYAWKPLGRSRMLWPHRHLVSLCKVNLIQPLPEVWIKMKKNSSSRTFKNLFEAVDFVWTVIGHNGDYFYNKRNYWYYLHSSIAAYHLDHVTVLGFPNISNWLLTESIGCKGGIYSHPLIYFLWPRHSVTHKGFAFNPTKFWQEKYVLSCKLQYLHFWCITLSFFKEI